MRRFAAGLCAWFLLFSLPGARGEAAAYPTATPLPGYVLRSVEEERLVFASMSLKGNLVGTLRPDTQEAEVLQVIDEWCYIRFSTEDGTRYGYVPTSYFDIETITPTPAPTEDAPTHAAGTSAWVVGWAEGYRLSLRKEPAYSAAILGKYYTGTPVTLTGQAQDGYVQVLLAGTTLGWLDERFITTDASAFVPELPMVTVNNPGSGANLRATPSSSGSRLGWYADGTAVTVLGIRADGWYHVMVEEEVGYISEGLLSGSFPYDYGMDSDNPALSESGTALYINMRSSTGRLNLRKSASTSAKSLGLFYTGTPLTVLSYTRTGWAYVRIGQMEGYVDADYLTESQPTRYGESRVVQNGRASGLNLRALPATGGELLAFAENGERVTVLGELNDGWCYVSYNGMLGYMLGSGLSGK